jgi:hypothetical protein
LSLRLVEEMLLERGIVGSYETIRRWGRKFGAAYVMQLPRKKPSRKDIWHLTRVCREASTAMWEPSCTEDEGRSLETDRQGYLKLLRKRRSHAYKPKPQCGQKPVA